MKKNWLGREGSITNWTFLQYSHIFRHYSNKNRGDARGDGVKCQTVNSLNFMVANIVLSGG